MKKIEVIKPRPKMSTDDQPIIPAPASMTVTDYQKPVLWLNETTVLVRKIGY